MAVPQINITLGTAGHIDHGKTALVKCLTGCDTDRLKEEKERGMSIDLGYAPCLIADVQVGIVDVPGHENFIKTMVAGATGMDAVLLVVAADDGVMPQTREHLEILTLLGIQHGMVALTKIDRVSPDHLELARADVQDLLRGTFLEGAPVVPVSNVTGEGFDRFFETLYSLVQSIRPKRSDGVFRLPLDRAFSVKGYGTVVAGVPVSGTAHTGDEIVLLPQGLSGRIRRIEVYGRDSDTVRAGQCAAMNVGHWDSHEIGRGDTIAAPGYFAAQEWFACTLRLLPRDKLVLKNGAEVKFHTGTSEVLATVYSLEEDHLRGGSQGLIQLRAKAPVVAGPGDRFILRMLSPVRTIGGGTIIEATPQRLKRRRANVCADLHERAEAVAEDHRFVAYCLRRAESLAAGETDLAQRVKVLPGRLQEILADLVSRKRARLLPGGLYVHVDTMAEAAQAILDILRGFHQQSPESPGMTLDQLRQAASIDKTVLDAAVALLKAEGRVVETNQRLATSDHRPTIPDKDQGYLEAIGELFRQQAFHPPGVEEIVQQTGAAEQTVQRLLRILREHGTLVQVEDLLFHREAVDRAREILVEVLRQEGRLESVRVKYLLNTTRKFALPLLDYFDRIGVTRRVGNTRFLKAAPGSGGNSEGRS